MSAGPDMPAAAAPVTRRGVTRFKDRVRDTARAILAPVVEGIYGVGLRADHLTWLGFLLSIGSAFAFFDGHFRLGALLLALSGVCDILDGALARRHGAMSRFGAFLDSYLDRLSEALVLTGITAFYVRNLFGLILDPVKVLQQLEIGLSPETWAVMAVTSVLALVGSFMVSYSRARAEGLGLECKVGWFERPERLVLLIVAGLLKVFWAMSVALILLTLFSFATAIQRAAHVHRQTRGAGRDSL